jgi:molecular chaperone GrpE
MTKKKKFQDEEMKNNNMDDVIENKDIISQDKESANDNVGTDSKEAQAADGIRDSLKTEQETKAESDKEVKTISAEEKLAEIQDRYLRLSAEFDNYRKRTLREKMELTKHAGENILISIITVLDDFERALKLMETASDCVAMKSGIDLIYNKFSDFLTQHGLKEIESLN